jgi:putative ABC transport system substrate-binding protein
VLAAELTNFYEYAMCGKWLSLLKELAPSVARVAVLQNPNPSWAGYRQSIATATPSLGVEAIASGVRSPAEIDIAIDALARAPAGGLLVLPDSFNNMHRDNKILRCTKAGDIPVEQPVKFELVINRIVARALRLEIPPTLLARADEVIE